MKEGYSCNYEKSRMEEWLNKNFINKEYIVFKEDLEKLEEYGEKKSITLGNLITIALSEVFYRWSDGSGLKLIVSDDLRDSSILNLDYKKGTSIDYNFKGNERLNELCSKFEEESKRAFKYERKYISEIFSNMICEKDEENKKVIIISTNLFKEPKEKIENCNDNDYYCHERELYGVYINEDHIPDAIIQCYIEKSSGDLKIIWYLNNEFYTNEMCNDMERAHKEFINWIGKGYWDEIVPDLMPQSQKEIRKRINSTKVSVKKQLLHQQFFLNAEKYEKNQAILWDENGDTKSMTYGELANKALKLGALLMKQGVKQGDVVAITQPRGVNQIISVLGILAVGAAYVPVGIKQPKERRDRIYKIGGIKHVVMCEEELEKESLEESIEVILIKDLENIEPIAKPINMETDSLAYVIFTSGSTGEPKGVEITHEAAYNTIIDINTRFSIDSNDKALNISSFDFDLSVYDVFGMLSVGGGIVLLKEGEEREASIWSELVNRTKVTVWNSVPALFDMFLTGSGNNMLNSLKLVLVSGDWVGLDLQERLLKKSKHCRFIALGGATEASIWSNYYEVKEVHKSWTSIPYGTPLTNQCFRVINKLGKDCPDMVPGELWIGGMGVARGYIGDKELTSRSFVIKDSERWYRTGDLGRYWKDGIIEFLGRADHQVKLRGFRIELGEIEAALKQYKGVGQGVASVISSGDSKHLVAAVVMDNMKGQIAPSLEFNEHIESYRSNIREKQSEIVEALIIEILGLNNLNRDSIKERNFIEEFKIDREYKQLLKMWLLWLNERKVIDYRHGVIYEGLRFHKAITYINSLKEGSEWDNEEFILAIGKTILKKLEDYRAILRGEKSSFILLDDNNLSPENLASKDSGTLEGIKVISDRIKVISRKNHRPVKVALIGGRNGVMAEILLKLLHPSQIELTLLDSASSMLRDAEEKLSRYEHSIGYEVLKDNCVAENLRYSFDVAVAINSLHRYHNSYEGVALASLLLKNGGKIFALEHCELAPIALVTAAILEKGFKDLDHERKERFTSMLNSHEWSNLFSKYGFTAIEYSSIKESFTELIEGICPLERPILQIEEITNFITKLLPQHMIPEKIEVLSSLPLTSNGKVNRKELERVFHFTTENKSIEEAHEGMEKYVEQLWIKLIGVSRVSRDEGFFEIGGDSLLATRFIAQIKESVGVDISLKNIFEKPLLHQVAEYIESNLEDLEQSACSMEEGEI